MCVCVCVCAYLCVYAHTRKYVLLPRSDVFANAGMCVVAPGLAALPREHANMDCSRGLTRGAKQAGTLAAAAHSSARCSRNALPPLPAALSLATPECEVSRENKEGCHAPDPPLPAALSLA